MACHFYLLGGMHYFRSMTDPGNDILKLFGRNILAKCQKKDITLEELASRTKMDINKLELIVQGLDEDVRARTLEAIAIALGVSYADLLE